MLYQEQQRVKIYSVLALCSWKFELPDAWTDVIRFTQEIQKGQYELLHYPSFRRTLQIVLLYILYKYGVRTNQSRNISQDQKELSGMKQHKSGPFFSKWLPFLKLNLGYNSSFLKHFSWNRERHLQRTKSELGNTLSSLPTMHQSYTRRLLNLVSRPMLGGTHARTECLLSPVLLWNGPAGHLQCITVAKDRCHFREGSRHYYLAYRIWGNSTRQKLGHIRLCICDQSAYADSR